jgi:hypothetical protein
MQKLKDDGFDPSKPNFSTPFSPGPIAKMAVQEEIRMTKPGLNRKISPAELQSPEAKKAAWFVVRGEVSARILPG